MNIYPPFLFRAFYTNIYLYKKRQKRCNTYIYIYIANIRVEVASSQNVTIRAQSTKT